MKKNVYYRIILALLLVCFITPMASANDTLTAKAYPVIGSDGIVEVTNIIEYTGDISAIGIKIDLPYGVEFQEATSDIPPAVGPRKGDTGLLEFAWIMPPASPFTFTYSAQVYAEDAEDTIHSLVTYRRTGKPLYTDVDPIKVK